MTKEKVSVERMLGIKDVAARLGVAEITVRRLADTGRMPQPVKIGWLLKWDRPVLENWIAAGCPRTKGGRHV